MQAIARVFASRRRYEFAQRAARRGQGPFVRDGSVRSCPGRSARGRRPATCRRCRSRASETGGARSAVARVADARARSSAGSGRRCATCRRRAPRRRGGRARLPARAASARRRAGRAVRAARRRVPGAVCGASRRRSLPHAITRRAGGRGCGALAVAARRCRERVAAGRGASSCATTGSARPSSTRSTARSPAARPRSPRPGRSCSTAAALSGRRALTLVPDHHICVVHAEQIVDQIAEALAARRRGGDRAARPDHAHLGAVGDLGHRARARRGRARPTPSPPC